MKSMDDDTTDLFDEPAPATAAASNPPPAVPPAPTFENAMGDGSSLPLAAYAERAYLAYAMSVVRARALPQVEDGLNFQVHRLLVNAVERHAVAHHPAGLGARLTDRHLMAEQREDVRDRQARGSRADDCHLAAFATRRRSERDEIFARPPRRRVVTCSRCRIVRWSGSFSDGATT